MTIETVLLILLILFITGTIPAWPYSRSWGYTPVGVLSFLLIVFIIWAVVAERSLFSSSGSSLESSVEEVGDDLEEAGRDVADSIRDTVD